MKSAHSINLLIYWLPGFRKTYLMKNCLFRVVKLTRNGEKKVYLQLLQNYF